MRYFGIPHCPYCRKRVNFLRTWSLRKQGEYKCPRCGGISNIYHSPLIWVFAVLAIFCGGAIYFFYKFILEAVEIKTVLYVTVPFMAFFLLSFFMVYLKQPVIKKVPQKGKPKGAPVPMAKKEPPQDGERRMSINGGSRRDSRNVNFRDDDEIMPETFLTGQGPAVENHSVRQKMTRPGPMPQKNGGVPPVRKRTAQPSEAPGENRRMPRTEEQVPVSQAPGRKKPVAGNGESNRPAAPQKRPRPVQIVGEAEENLVQPTSVNEKPVNPVEEKRVSVDGSAAPVKQEVVRDVKSIEISDDFFAKYDDPDYIEKRLSEMENET